MKKGFSNEYFAYDEIDFSSEVQKIMEVYKTTNLNWVADKQEIIGFEGQIILSEVIEHNPFEEAKALLVWIRDNTNFSTLYITTPDKNFNTNYEMVNEFRHDDHDFELTNEEFVILINEIFPFENEFFGIGDCVNGIYPTSAVIIHKQ
jgi:hypothetical protein